MLEINNSNFKLNSSSLNNKESISTTTKNVYIDCIPVQEEDLNQIKCSLRKMTFSKTGVDIPSLLYGASVSCFFSTVLVYNESSPTPTIWGMAIAFISWISAGFLSKHPKYKNNNEKNESQRDHALETIERVFRSSNKNH